MVDDLNLSLMMQLSCRVEAGVATNIHAYAHSTNAQPYNPYLDLRLILLPKVFEFFGVGDYITECKPA